MTSIWHQIVILSFLLLVQHYTGTCIGVRALIRSRDELSGSESQEHHPAQTLRLDLESNKIERRVQFPDAHRRQHVFRRSNGMSHSEQTTSHPRDSAATVPMNTSSTTLLKTSSILDSTQVIPASSVSNGVVRSTLTIASSAIASSATIASKITDETSSARKGSSTSTFTTLLFSNASTTVTSSTLSASNTTGAAENSTTTVTTLTTTTSITTTVHNNSDGKLAHKTHIETLIVSVSVGGGMCVIILAFVIRYRHTRRKRNDFELLPTEADDWDDCDIPAKLRGNTAKNTRMSPKTMSQHKAENNSTPEPLHGDAYPNLHLALPQYERNDVDDIFDDPSDENKFVKLSFTAKSPIYE
eukprot:m.209323 g.209323  ORF g.209323 m.209323 type:complete len:357 (+) comp18975_c0_seq3:271-1341(+)